MGRLHGFTVSEQVRRVERMNAAGIEAVLNQPKWAANKFVLGAVAQNPNATAADLHRIVMTGRTELYDRMGSAFDVMGKNTKGLAVMRLVIQHPNTAPEDLERLATSKNEYILSDLAGNPKLSQATLKRLTERGGHLIEWGLARHPQTPQSSLVRFAQSSDEYTRTSVAANPCAPAEVLEALSKDQVFHIRANVAQNPPTPNRVVEQLLSDADERVSRTAQGQMDRRKTPSP